MATGLNQLEPFSRLSVPPYPTTLEQAPQGWSLPIVPNFSDWSIGDMVLVAGEGLPGKAMSGARRILGLPSGSHWTHCGLYAGDGQMIGAAPATGISIVSVESFVSGRTIAVLRLAADPSVPIDAGLQAVQAAKARLGQNYAWTDLVLLVKNWGVVGPNRNGDAAYCSALVVHSFAAASVPLDTLQGYCPCLPATLSQHPWLEDVWVEWRCPI